ncbi:hypothetical protein L2E82_01817 [Cichorium intybus]|uniref:Uncharacterized protein n=1 Tax=Cichorium intybus TaxID=13427 RepID=A0ACB9H0F8_CICIN|nr:hypothetical protein L2E82_01817 [Cichorium intybus]
MNSRRTILLNGDSGRVYLSSIEVKDQIGGCTVPIHMRVYIFETVDCEACNQFHNIIILFFHGTVRFSPVTRGERTCVERSKTESPFFEPKT